MPCRLIGVRAGDLEAEAELHAAFAEHSIRGEWFAPHDDILAYIEQNCEIPTRTTSREADDKTEVTATVVKKRLGPTAAIIAKDAGWKRSAWDVAVHRKQALTREQVHQLAAALKEYVVGIQDVVDFLESTP